MQRYFKITIPFTIFLTIFLNACGPSPLFHHKSEAELKTSTPTAESRPEHKPEELQCQFYWGNEECWVLNWNSGPLLKGESSFTVTLMSTVTKLPLRSTSSPEFDLWMPDMNHGSAPIKIIRLDDSQFQATKVFFIMRGHWVLRLKHGKNILAQVDVEI